VLCEITAASEGKGEREGGYIVECGKAERPSRRRYDIAVLASDVDWRFGMSVAMRWHNRQGGVRREHGGGLWLVFAPVFDVARRHVGDRHRVICADLL